MRRKLSLILVVVLAIILAASLIACGRKVQNVEPPEQIAPGSGNSGIESQAARIAMTFKMPYANSVFNAIFIDDFHIEDVQYSFVYYAADGSELSSKPMGALSEDMVAAADRHLLREPGNHYINVTATLDGGKEITGKFQLRLKDNLTQLAPVELRFLLNDGETAFFGRSGQTQGTGTKYALTEVDENIVFESWSDFLNAFRFAKKNYAISSFKMRTSDDKIPETTLSEKQGFPLTIKKCASGVYYSFDPVWTRDAVQVKFNLNLPKGAKYFDGEDDPAALFTGDGEYANVSVARSSRAVVKPDTSRFNKYYGLYFSGWYLPKYTDDHQLSVNKANGNVDVDLMWDFSKAVDSDIELYAKWTIHNYSYTIYPMGGEFKSEIAASKKGETTITEENYGDLGYKLLSSSSRFTTNGTLMRVSFEGFNYGDNYSDYVAKVTYNKDGDTVMLLFSEIYDLSNRVFEKDDSLAFAGIFEDYVCETPYAHTGDGASVGGDRVGYIGWNVKTDSVNAYINRLFAFTVKADGSVRIDSTKDNSVNVIKLPATVDLGDNYGPRMITEIGERACTNLKSLREVDVSEAIYLTTIGKEAFAFDTNLKTFKQPTDTEEKQNNNITIVGENAFENTAYEERYTNISGLDFIIINKVIYKYTGTPDESGIVNLNVDNYYTEQDFADLPGVDAAQAAEAANKQLKAATHIMGGAFANAKTLKELYLDGIFEYIEADAFAGLRNFEKLSVPQQNNLKYVSESAFEDCDLFLSSSSGNYNGDMGAILIGNIYYYQVDREKQSVFVTATYNFNELDYDITMIAAHAFNGCSDLAEINFESSDAIESVGEDAFKGTAYEKKSNPNPIIINGILAGFYGPTTKNYSVTSDVKTIAEGAFGDSASNLTTLDLRGMITDAGETSIGAYAFKGAESLKSIILSSINAADGKLENAPRIQSTTFASKDGTINSDMILYFNKAAIEFFESYAQKDTSAITDPATKEWVDFYKRNPENFKEDVISSVTLDMSSLKSVFVDKDDKAPLDASRALALFKEMCSALKLSDEAALSRLLRVASNTGETRYEPFDPEKASFKAITSTDPESGDYFADGMKFVMQYNYDPNYPDVFPDEKDDEDAVIISVFKAVQGNPQLNATYSYNSYNSESSGMWIEGLKGNASGQSGLPTFFTGTDEEKLNAAVKFCYKDVMGGKHEIDIDITKVAGFNLNAETPISTVTIVVDFYGAGEYRFNYNYTVRNAKYTDIVQKSAITVPLNADAASIIGSSTLFMLGEDGKYTEMPISGNFRMEEVTSDDLGQLKVEVTFNREKECLNSTPLAKEIIYTVVLEANPADFSYEIISEPSSDANGTARITGYINSNARTVRTIIIPETYEQNGNKYDVTMLGNISSAGAASTGLFSNCPNLQTVYLSEKILIIGTRAFSGLTRLKSVRTALESSTTLCELTAKNFEVVEDPKIKQESKEDGLLPVKYVKLVNTDGAKYYDGGSYYGLYIGAEYIVDVEGGKEIYKVCQVEDGLILPSKTEEKNIYLYFPSTIYNEFSLKMNDTVVKEKDGTVKPGYSVNFYEDGKGRFIVYDRLDSALSMIGANAFSGCTSLKFNENSFEQCTNLNFIGVRAFANSGIEMIDLSKATNLTEINNGTFEGCAQLTSVKFVGVTEVSPSAFSGCYMLSELVGFENLQIIGANAFENCRSLKEITLTAACTSIGDDAFRVCSALVIKCTFAKVPSGWAPRWNSSNCPVIYNSESNKTDENGNRYWIEDGVRYMIISDTNNATVTAQSFDIERAVIKGQISVDGAQYNVTSIAANAFEGCVWLEEVQLPESVRTIGNYAFKDCTSLTTFTFAGDNGLTSLGQDPFDGCVNLAVKPSVPKEFEKGDFKYSINRANQTVTISGLATSIGDKTDFTIGDTVTYAGIEYKIVAIADNAFQGSTMKSITLGANVASIGTGAFVNCKSLTKVTATAALKTIGEKAFQGCSSLDTFDGYGQLDSVADDAFDGCEKLANKPEATN